jgi:hypothetical protein
MSEVEFDIPSLEIEFCEILGGIQFGIKKGRSEDDPPGTESFDVNVIPQLADVQSRGETKVIVLSQPARTFFRSIPGNDVIEHTQDAATTKINIARLMHSNDHIDTSKVHESKLCVCAESSIRQHDITCIEEGAKEVEERQIMKEPLAEREVQHRAGGQAEHRNVAHYGEPATGLLRGRLGIHLLIGSRIGHGGSRTVHDLNDTAVPEFLRGGFPTQGKTYTSAQTAEQSFGKPFARLAVTAGISRESCATQTGEVGIDAGEGLPAGMVGIQSLPDPCPENNQRGKKPIAGIGDFPPGVPYRPMMTARTAPVDRPAHEPVENKACVRIRRYGMHTLVNLLSLWISI